MVIGRRYIEDAASVDIFAHIGAYTGDVLITHGTEDPVVPPAYSQRAAQVYGENAQLHWIEGMGHGFRSGLPEHHAEAMSLAFAFFTEHIVQEGR